MVSVKLARLKTNLDQGHLHYDTLLDTIGYLACINMIHQPESTTNDNPKTQIGLGLLQPGTCLFEHGQKKGSGGGFCKGKDAR